MRPDAVPRDERRDVGAGTTAASRADPGVLAKRLSRENLPGTESERPDERIWKLLKWVKEAQEETISTSFSRAFIPPWSLLRGRSTLGPDVALTK